MVIKYIAVISDSHLFEIYGLDLLKFLGNHFNSNDLQVKKEAYLCINTLIRESEELIL